MIPAGVFAGDFAGDFAFVLAFVLSFDPSVFRGGLFSVVPEISDDDRYQHHDLAGDASDRLRRQMVDEPAGRVDERKESGRICMRPL